MKLPYKNSIAVAAHRGNSKYFPENTMAAFRSAKELCPDMIEFDVHMTRDGELIIMHDHTVDRTTDGKGLIREKTLAEIKLLDAGYSEKFGDSFRGERVPTLAEFFELFKDAPDMLFNVELKDYPSYSKEFSHQSAHKTIALMDEYGVTERSVINTWSGELIEWLAQEYGDGIKLHAYSPQERMGRKQRRFLYDYAYCVCMLSVEEPETDAKRFEIAKAYGVEPWVYYPIDTPEHTDGAIAKGAALFTSNDPKWLMDYLRSKGLHS